MKMTLGVTAAVLLGMGCLAGPAQAFLVEGGRCPSCAGSVYELPLTPFGGAAYHALLSSEKYGFSSPSAFLHLGAGSVTDTTALGSADAYGHPRWSREHGCSRFEHCPVRHGRGERSGVQPRRLSRGRADGPRPGPPRVPLGGHGVPAAGRTAPPRSDPRPSGQGHAGRGPGPRTRHPVASRVRSRGPGWRRVAAAPSRLAAFSIAGHAERRGSPRRSACSWAVAAYVYLDPSLPASSSRHRPDRPAETRQRDGEEGGADQRRWRRTAATPPRDRRRGRESPGRG